MSKIKSVVAAALTLATVGTAAHAALFTVSYSPIVSIGGGLSETIVSLTFVNAASTGINGGSTITSPTGTTFNFKPVFDDAGSKAPSGQTATLDDFNYATEEGAFSDAGGSVALTQGDGTTDTHFLYVVGQPGLDGAPGVTQTEQTALGVSVAYTKKTTNLTTFNTLGITGTGSLAFKSTALTQPLAQLVFPSTDTGNIAYNLVDLTGTAVTGVIPTGAASPEPASLGLLGLGGVALLSRRKAKSAK